MSTQIPITPTERPWRVEPINDKRHHYVAIMAPWKSDEHQKYHPLIVNCYSGLGFAPAGVAEANAELIVKAVNEHESLKKKLHEIELAVEGYVDGAPDRDASAKLANQIMQIIEGKN